MRRVWILAAIAAAVVIGAVVAIVVVSSNDGGGNKDATAWADSVCSSIDDWRTSITSLADVSGGTLTKDSLREKLDDADAATRDLVSSLKDLGPPDLESGDALQTRLDTDADALQSSYDSLKAKAQDALDASSTTAFLSALAALATPFQNLVNQISTTLEDLRGADDVSADARAELQRAFDDAEACQKLSSEQ